MKSVALLGSTGSIGRRTLQVVSAQAHPEEIRVVALAAGENISLLSRQIMTYSPRLVSVTRKEDADALAKRFPDVRFYSGPQGLMEAISLPEVNIVVSAITGTVSMEANLATLKRGLRLCLANKETLVAAGELVQRELARSGGELIPVDSEHSAIFQCIQGQGDSYISRVILTASGGPFFRSSLEELSRITVEMALRHPTWKMGRKITIDSATMMNKALEVIEAGFLFPVDENGIDVLIHPQSIVHSLVEFVDGSVLAQMGRPDMGLPIHYALNFPQRSPFKTEALNLGELGKLDFFPPEKLAFPSLDLARHALKSGCDSGAVLNAANEVAVEAFLDHRISFMDIFRLVETVYGKTKFSPVESLAQIHSSIRETRTRAREWLESNTGDQS